MIKKDIKTHEKRGQLIILLKNEVYLTGYR